MLSSTAGSNSWSQVLSVRLVPVTNAAGRTTAYRLDIYDGQTCIGEYERCKKDTHMARKMREVQCAAQLLRTIYAQHGKFEVRWVGEAGKHRKEIRSQKDGCVLDIIPRSCWGQS